MSASMARQEGRVQLQQSGMRLACSTAKMAKEGFSGTAIEEMQYLIKKLCTKVRDDKEQSVNYPGHHKAEAAIQSRMAMLRQHHIAGFLACQNGTAKNWQTCRTRMGTGTPPPNRSKQLTPELTSPLPGMPPTQTSNHSRAECSEIVNLPAGYVYSYTTPHCTEFFSSEAYAQDSQQDTDFIPDMLTDEGTSIG